MVVGRFFNKRVGTLDMTFLKESNVTAAYDHVTFDFLLGVIEEHN